MTDGTEGEQGEPPKDNDEVRELLHRRLRERVYRTVNDADQWREDIERQQAQDALLQKRADFQRLQIDLKEERKVKRRYANTLLVGMFIQIAVTDTAFFLYASSKNVQWEVPVAAMNVWLGATVVQVIGVVEIVTRHLFPRRDLTPPAEPPA